MSGSNLFVEQQKKLYNKPWYLFFLASNHLKSPEVEGHSEGKNCPAKRQCYLTLIHTEA